jgi:hypothetical protein
LTAEAVVVGTGLLKPKLLDTDHVLEKVQFKDFEKECE